MHYDLTTLPNGLRVITEAMPSLRSIALGCWVDTGTRDETGNEAGVSHFLEHLLFKGSERLSAREVSETFDAIGAESNAFTSKESTCYWARLLDQDLHTGLDVLSEIIQRPAFRPHEIDAERQVVIEEINMSEDDPDDVAHENFTRAAFTGHILEASVLGTRESIRAMTRDDIDGYWKRRYGAGSMVVAAAGSIDHEAFVDMIVERFGGWDGEPVPHELSPASHEARVELTHRETEQAHLILGGPGLDRGDERRWAFEVLNHVVGGGMSSRLFREIREERGLAYAVYGFRLSFADNGVWGVYVGTTPSQTDTCLNIIREELAKVVAEGITETELDRAKGSMRGGLALSMEDANSRMIRLGRDELAGLPHLSVDERLAKIEGIGLDQVREVASDLYGAETRFIGAVGPFQPDDLAGYLS
ncbi:MAG: insulinase family protein [Actinobacteria bacterium]|nr:insulinase family protein [Actinomycetota bacterium]MCI0543113.1 insulinase family protein [Actinomycetota bacterium]